MEVSVIVPARDAAGTIGRTLAGLAAQRCAAPWEAIVVDNGSLDDTAAIAAASPLAPRVIRRVRGEGPAAARNEGAAAARGRVLAFTDADCEPAPGWLAAGLAAAERADLVQGAVVPDPAAAPGPFDRTLWVTAEHGLYESANLFVRREAFERLGGFAEVRDAPEEAPFGEDAWLGWRLRRSGARTAFCAQALVHHAVFPRGAAGYVAERRRLALFPALAARIPELRAQLFWGRLFLTRRSAAFDLALLGALAAVAARSPLPLAAAAPYAALVASDAARWGARLAPRVAVAGVAADAVGCAALLRGSLTARTPLL